MMMNTDPFCFLQVMRISFLCLSFSIFLFVCYPLPFCSFSCLLTSDASYSSCSGSSYFRSCDRISLCDNVHSFLGIIWHGWEREKRTRLERLSFLSTLSCNMCVSVLLLFHFIFFSFFYIFSFILCCWTWEFSSYLLLFSFSSLLILLLFLIPSSSPLFHPFSSLLLSSISQWLPCKTISDWINGPISYQRRASEPGPWSAILPSFLLLFPPPLLLTGEENSFPVFLSQPSNPYPSITVVIHGRSHSLSYNRSCRRIDSEGKRWNEEGGRNEESKGGT